ncbi:hypothetical protein [Peribacillus simplex]|uniref:Uncharacterized protein n=2 Tax=Peribacillus simplex TaxID=1478 RepID=A0A223EHK8_9BACI|nr:hypothetical protein [Peribacillus simplex]ASS94720.1 hypothetical protein BS1321_12815 [Peribacillus simplex NBRC 15720 = DSM 1321]MEC1396825.1 hypothetical protein [Peribacillus simplex]MED3908193.1 hypothetical protein [Peribacillus simplex]MED3983327.1 hypothetical protein [Peribacillus simplex]MED4092427.1 hypothetical protein [Peribacillus simplex]
MKEEAVPVIQERLLLSFNTTLAFTETVKGLYDRQRRPERYYSFFLEAMKKRALLAPFFG